MIANEREYRITKQALRRFEQTRAVTLDEVAVNGSHLQYTYIAAIESEIDALKQQITEYEGLREGGISEYYLTSLLDLPHALIAGRIAAGLTQAGLAEQMGLKAQQIQRYEATRYESASFARMVEVADTLGLRLAGTVHLPSASPTSEKDERVSHIAGPVRKANPDRTSA